MNIQCQKFLMLAPDWLEGQRSPEGQAHLEVCAECRNYVSEMQAISATARELECATPEPPERIWVALRNQLEEDGIIQPAEVASAGWAKLWNDWVTGFAGVFRRPALAAMYAAVLVLAISLSFGPGQPGLDMTYLSQGEGPVNKLANDLESGQVRAVSGLSSRNPEVAATYRASLELVDKFIAVCEKTVREEPNNEIARDYLMSAYQQKAELLTTIMDRQAGD